MASFNNILCAVDFDRNSLLALRVASELARSSKGILHIFHVVGLPSDTSSFEKLETTAQRKLERLASRVCEAVQYRVHVTDANPDVEILVMATRLRANMIVMADSRLERTSSYPPWKRRRSRYAGGAMPCAYRKTQGSASPSSTRQKGARLKRMEPRPSAGRPRMAAGALNPSRAACYLRAWRALVWIDCR
jgi:nucleotide-binding universal stress UspA family protein